MSSKSTANERIKKRRSHICVGDYNDDLQAYGLQSYAVVVL